MTPEAHERNEAILSEIEQLGGGYVWDPEVFAVTLIDVSVSDQEASVLLGLIGVEQIAIDVSKISPSVLHSIAHISNLKSLVIAGRDIAPEELSALESVGPDIQMVGHEA